MHLPSKFLEQVLKHEGGFVNHPLDRGGATNKGVTFKAYTRYAKEFLNKHDITVDDLKLISDVDIYKFYNIYYWIPCRGADLLECNLNKSALKLFDLSVNCGSTQAIKFLQRAINVSDDGVFGATTRNAVLNFKNDDLLIQNLRKYAKIYYEAIVINNPTQKVFLSGWLNRLEK